MKKVILIVAIVIAIASSIIVYNNNAYQGLKIGYKLEQIKGQQDKFSSIYAWNYSYRKFKHAKQKPPINFNELIEFMKANMPSSLFKSAFPLDKIESSKLGNNSLLIKYKGFPWNSENYWCVLEFGDKNKKRIDPSMTINKDWDYTFKETENYFVNSYCRYPYDWLGFKYFEQGIGLSRQKAQRYFPEIMNE